MAANWQRVGSDVGNALRPELVQNVVYRRVLHGFIGSHGVFGEGGLNKVLNVLLQEGEVQSGLLWIRRSRNAAGIG